MKLLSLDLEMNFPNTLNTIIQVGYAIGDTDTREILDRGSWFIRLPEGQELQPAISQLCGIKPEDLAGGITLQEAYEGLKALAEKYGIFRNGLAWGQGDFPLLRKQLGLDDEVFLFGRREIDAKTVFISYCIANGLKVQSGLAKSMTRLGMAFKGRKHNAEDDAYNTLLIYFKLLDLLKKDLK